MSLARARGGCRSSPRRFWGRTYMICASWYSDLAFRAAMSASSASTRTWFTLPLYLSPTVNLIGTISVEAVWPAAIIVLADDQQGSFFFRNGSKADKLEVDARVRFTPRSGQMRGESQTSAVGHKPTIGLPRRARSVGEQPGGRFTR